MFERDALFFSSQKQDNCSLAGDVNMQEIQANLSEFLPKKSSCIGQVINKAKFVTSSRRKLK